MGVVQKCVRSFTFFFLEIIPLGLPFGDSKPLAYKWWSGICDSKSGGNKFIQIRA